MTRRPKCRHSSPLTTTQRTWAVTSRKVRYRNGKRFSSRACDSVGDRGGFSALFCVEASPQGMRPQAGSFHNSGRNGVCELMNHGKARKESRFSRIVQNQTRRREERAQRRIHPRPQATQGAAHVFAGFQTKTLVWVGVWFAVAGYLYLDVYLSWKWGFI